MAGVPLVYKADDRSLLLPFYRRLLIDPLVPLVPRSVSPNAITHAGHMINFAGVALLLGTWREHGWTFVAAAILLQLYIWCDNADGAHARRTNQCSATGELLDHGLDILNVIYMGYVTAMALGLSPLGWVILVAAVAGAASITYWEQSETGVFRLGMMNQVESGLILSVVLVISATFGRSAWANIELLGVTPRTAMVVWTVATILVGMVRSIGRVTQARGAAATIPALVLVAASGSVLWASWSGALTTVAAVVILTAMNVFFAMRMLLVRLKKSLERAPDTTFLRGGLALEAAAVAGHAALCAIGGGADPAVASLALGGAAVAVFGAQALLDAREAMHLLSRVEPRTPAVAP